MKTITILTIPRSCSSLLAGILHRLGVWMGPNDEMVLGRHLNKYGCYENQDFLRLDMNFMFSSHILLDYTDRVTIKERKLARNARRYRRKYRKIIQKNQKKVWGFKDAALIYIIPYIHDLLPNPYYIHLERDHDSTARSIRKTFESNTWFHEMREKLPHFTWENRLRIVTRAISMFLTRNKRMYSDAFYRKMVDIGHNRIRQFTKDKPVLNVHTDEIFNTTEKTIEKIIKYLKISPSDAQKRRALKFVHPELIHN